MCMLAALTLTASSVAAQGRNVVVKPIGPIAGQYIVVFNDSVANSRGLANAMARANGISLRGVYSTVLKGFAGRMPETVALRLAANPNVAYVEQDLYAQAIAEFGVERVGAPGRLYDPG